MTVLAIVNQLPSRLLIALLRIYQRVLSPALPVIFGPACGCRFSPSCSHYAIQAVQTHGALIGSAYAVTRLIKCTPLHPGGFDPVPARSRYSCTLVSSPRPAKADSTAA